KDANLNFGGLVVLEKLVAPFDIVQGEGDLLDGFEADDFGDFFGFDRGELDEAGERLLAADTDTDLSFFDPGMTLDEIVEGGLDEGFAVVPGGGEDGFVLDDFKIIDAGALGGRDELDGLEGAVTDIDAPGEAR